MCAGVLSLRCVVEFGVSGIFVILVEIEGVMFICFLIFLIMLGEFWDREWLWLWRKQMAMPSTTHCMVRKFSHSRTMLLRERCALGTSSPELLRLNTCLASARIIWKPLRCTPLEEQVFEFFELDFTLLILCNVYDCFEYIIYAYAWLIELKRNQISRCSF